MIRKSIIVLLTLGAVCFVSVWIDSYRFGSGPRWWFVVPYEYETRGVCEFQIERDHVSSLGWHLWYRALGGNNNQYVCFLASQGFISVRWVTHSTPNVRLSGGATGPIHRIIGGFEFQSWRGMVPQGSNRGGYAAWRCQFPIWSAATLLATYPTIAFIRGPLRHWRRWRRRRKGLCLKCGYNLTGNESGVCPECGTKVEQA